MARFVMWFSRLPQLSLERTEFSWRPMGISRTVRGKTCGVFQGHATFQWTSAVKALVILMLRSAAQEASHFVLSGIGRSPASSLDYAICKKTSWLMDMFGVDTKGNLGIRRVLVRTNSHRKHGARVSLALNAHILASQDINVYLDGTRLSEPAKLGALASEVEALFDNEAIALAPARTSTAPREARSAAALTQLRDLIRAEIRELWNEMTNQSELSPHLVVPKLPLREG